MSQKHPAQPSTRSRNNQIAGHPGQRRPGLDPAQCERPVGLDLCRPGRREEHVVDIWSDHEDEFMVSEPAHRLAPLHGHRLGYGAALAEPLSSTGQARAGSSRLMQSAATVHRYEMSARSRTRSPKDRLCSEHVPPPTSASAADRTRQVADGAGAITAAGPTCSGPTRSPSSDRAPTDGATPRGPTA